MTSIVSTIVVPKTFIFENYAHGRRIEDTWSRVQQIASEQIKFNFETTLPEIRTVVLDTEYASLPRAFSVNSTAIIKNLFLLAGCLCCFIAFSQQTVIQFEVDFLIKMLAIIPITYFAASIYSTLTNTHRPFYYVSSHPYSLNIPLEDIANEQDKKNGCFINHLDMESFPEIMTPRQILIGKRICDLSSTLFYMLTTNKEEGEIPHPFNQGILTEKEKDKFIIDLSRVLSVPPEILKKCWQQKITDSEIAVVKRLLLENKDFTNQLNQLLTEAQQDNKPANEESIKSELLASHLNNSLPAILVLKKLKFFFKQLPGDSKVYFPEIVNKLESTSYLEY